MSLEDLNRQDEEENAERERRARGIPKPKLTNFPDKGDNKEISLSSSNHQEFPFELADRIRKSRPDLWKLGSAYGSLSFRLWRRTKDGDYSKAIENWIKKRESWGDNNLDDALTPAKVLNMIKYGLISRAGKESMMRTLDLTLGGVPLKDTHLESSGES